MNLKLVLSWYIACVCALTFSLSLLIHSSFTQQVDTPVSSNYISYRALPTVTADTNRQIVTINKSDGRILIVRNFFQDYNAPLSEFAEEFINVADRYQLDYRLLPAISMQESNGGKRMPSNSHNPFGYGIYGDKVLRFPSFAAAIEAVGKGLRNNYLDKGLQNPESIMTKYTPPSVPLGGPWAKGVTTFMDELL